MRTDVPSANRRHPSQGTYSQKLVEMKVDKEHNLKLTLRARHQEHQDINYLYLLSSNHTRLTHIRRLVALPPPDV